MTNESVPTLESLYFDALSIEVQAEQSEQSDLLNQEVQKQLVAVRDSEKVLVTLSAALEN